MPSAEINTYILLSGPQRIRSSLLVGSVENAYLTRISSKICFILETSSSLPTAGGGCRQRRGSTMNLENPNDLSRPTRSIDSESLSFRRD